MAVVVTLAWNLCLVCNEGVRMTEWQDICDMSSKYVYIQAVYQ